MQRSRPAARTLWPAGTPGWPQPAFPAAPPGKDRPLARLGTAGLRLRAAPRAPARHRSPSPAAGDARQSSGTPHHKGLAAVGVLQTASLAVGDASALWVCRTRSHLGDTPEGCRTLVTPLGYVQDTPGIHPLCVHRTGMGNMALSRPVTPCTCDTIHVCDAPHLWDPIQASPTTGRCDTRATHRTCQASVQRAVHNTPRKGHPVTRQPLVTPTTPCCDTPCGATCPRVGQPWLALACLVPRGGHVLPLARVPVRSGTFWCVERAAGPACVRAGAGGATGGAVVTHTTQSPPLPRVCFGRTLAHRRLGFPGGIYTRPGLAGAKANTAGERDEGEMAGM